MKSNKKWGSLFLIVVLLLPLIPIPNLDGRNENNESHTSTSSVELDINYDNYRSSEAEQSEVDIQLIERKILELVNELRDEESLEPVQVNDMLKAGAIVRAQETEETFTHTRPNGTEPFTVLNEGEITYNYQIVGENLAMATHFLEDTEMAQFLFDGWVESEGHYETMVNPYFEEIGVGVHFDGEIIYATQLFGTLR